MRDDQTGQQEQEERQIAIGGVFTRQAGCLLLPFLPIRAAGALVITTTRLVFDPILFYKLFAKKREVKIEDVASVESSGENVGLNLMEIVSIGKTLKVSLKDGKSLSFRSMQADELAAIIDDVIHGRTPTQEDSPPGESAGDAEPPEDS